MTSPAFGKRSFTLTTFADSARSLFAQVDEVHAALTRPCLPRPLSEKIMLAVTRVNGCRYCSYAHARLALQAGVSETELDDLLAGEFDHIPPHEQTAILFAQHYAEQGDRYDAGAWQTLEETYGADGARDVLVHIRLITFANLYGNTFDALLERLRLRPVAGSRFLAEIVVLVAGATVVPAGLFLALIARRLSAVRPRRLVRTNRD
jgi:AhpD family alkylhydroperoxidase